MSTVPFPSSQQYETGYYSLFARGVDPAELLLKVSKNPGRPILLDRSEAEAIKIFGIDIDGEDVPGLDLDELQASGILEDDRPLLRAGSHGGWSFVIESEGPYLGQERILEVASIGTIAFSAGLTEVQAGWISYAEDGQILSSFDPLFPEQDYGKNPLIFEGVTEYREAILSGQRHEAYENAFRQIQRKLRCIIPQEVDAHRLLSVRAAGRAFEE
ncbi:DUF6461 domain-containing protein [Streptomyces sp. NPDC059378]|uniref:DUF6461 domain-containing protein n=1 Tax=Streptomyces sp. NPDC059378 TaxID=3346815 RepID=UPI0036A6597C